MSSFNISYSSTPYTYPKAKFVHYNPSSAGSKPANAEPRKGRKAPQRKSGDTTSLGKRAELGDTTSFGEPVLVLPGFSNVDSPEISGAAGSGFTCDKNGTVEMLALQH